MSKLRHNILMLKHKTKIIISVLTLSLILPRLPLVLATSPFCVTDKCKAAEQAEKDATNKARNATTAARTLESEVAKLNDEIAMFEARIAANQAISDDLTLQINLNTEKLKTKQASLAKMLVDIHFDGQPEAIMILASSNSISDYAEKQSRADTAKTQVNLSAQAVKNLKIELEKQQKEVKRIIVDQESQRKAVAERRAYQQDLVNKYRDNAEAFARDAEQARKEKEKAIAEEIARRNSTGAIGNGVDSYYAKDLCPEGNLTKLDQWGFICQCTSYAGYKAHEYWGDRANIHTWGNAYSWAIAAKRRGYTVNNTPAPFTIAVSTEGPWGHVMWVESVNSNGTINLSEYNNTYSAASHLPGDFGYRIGVSPAGLQFIHFDQ